MEKKKQQEYSARITQANPTELLVIVYELLQEELREALQAFEKEDYEGFDRSLERAQKFLQELMGTLNYQYKIAFQLLSLYKFVNQTIIEARLKVHTENVEGCIEIIERLRSGYDQIAAQDSKGPVMQNTQKLYAGLTYGKHALSEVSVDSKGGKRGLYA